MRKKVIPMIVLLIVLTACSPFPSNSEISTPPLMTAEFSTVMPAGEGTVFPVIPPESPTSVPTLSSGLSTTELKYRVVEEFSDFFFCDPDLYPIARGDESVLADQRFPELQADPDEFQAILAHNGLSGSTTFSDEQKLLIYREHKKLDAVYLELAGDRYQFQIQTGADGQQGTAITATIDANGSINVLQREPNLPSCPICLAAGTLIDTPRGAVGVENLKIGDVVWTMNEMGQRVQTIISETGGVRVPVNHQMVHVTLDDGRELWASPGHPTADGRLMQDLKMGDMLDEAQIVLLQRGLYGGNTTYDILPAGDTGFYWANGILVGSTLKK